MLLKRLTQLNGVSGCEKDVRRFITEEASKYCDKVYTDKAGNVIAYKKGSGTAPLKKVLVAAHMDEVGLIVIKTDSDGYIWFTNVGGIDSRILLGTRVVIGPNNVPGIIGYKPIHLQRGEYDKVAAINELYIDAGFSDDKQAKAAGIEMGTYISFVSEYIEFGDGCIKAKALDDRAGCAIMLNAMQSTYEADVYFAFTVKEEIGLGGAAVAAESIKPDAAIILECTTCSDVPFTKEWQQSTRQDKGPALTLRDNSVVTDSALTGFICATAEESGIPWQYKTTISGGTDGGVVHTAAGGIPSAVVSVPCRYIHSPSSVIKYADYKRTESLIIKVLTRIGEYWQ